MSAGARWIGYDLWKLGSRRGWRREIRRAFALADRERANVDARAWARPEPCAPAGDGQRADRGNGGRS